MRTLVQFDANQETNALRVRVFPDEEDEEVHELSPEEAVSLYEQFVDFLDEASET